MEAVGKDVTRLRPADEAFGIGKGTFARYARAPENKLAPKPANLTFEQASAVAISGLTALQGLRDHYTREELAEGQQRHDVILDIGGNSSLSRLRRALTPKGTLVLAGGETGGRWLGGSDRQVRALLLSPFVGQKLGHVHLP